MSTLQRWRDEGATPDEIRLLEAMKCESASEEARARTLAALGLGVLGGTAAGATVIGKTWSVSLAAKWLSVCALLGACGMVAWYVTRPQPPRTTVPAPPRTTPSAERASTSPPPISPASISVDDLPRATPATTSVATHAATVAPTDALARELEALDRARRSLARGDASAAKRELDAYRKEFPNGELAPEETVLRVRVLLALGQREDARALADDFEAAHPSSPYAARVHALVHE
jgi:hypothetical protein